MKSQEDPGFQYLDGEIDLVSERSSAVKMMMILNVLSVSRSQACET